MFGSVAILLKIISLPDPNTMRCRCGALRALLGYLFGWFGLVSLRYDHRLTLTVSPAISLAILASTSATACASKAVPHAQAAEEKKRSREREWFAGWCCVWAFHIYSR